MFKELRRRVNQVVKASSLISNPVYRRGLLSGIGAAIEHRHVLKSMGGLDLILDVGANKGQFSLVTRAHFPHADIVAFEPLPDMAKRCRDLFASDVKFQLIDAAVGPVHCDMDIHVSNRPDSSSLLPIGTNQQQLFPGTGEKSRLTVRVAPLADLLTFDIDGKTTLLKIDVQGFELEVLRGSSAILSKIEYIYVESSFITLYDGQSLIPDVIGFLSGHDFVLKGVFNLSYTDDHLPIQGDFLFQRLSRN